ncbi:tripartite tricarboxylate transporter substrate binding protein [Xanthobacter autotrophicus]|uniref:tripartite tricarboxylate transporter substrate binding protein n=1 Tax=Xanthobacter TaxID=279 RepID=UPI0024AB9C6B|nr:tripartite tricarboxylate transporter substrate binding protein [Xanthobacter autotrophicus]MDI4664067.1 tripartite tricarboxylate transporter substrate binding protein [Xanthobacter autotrophicus]
MRRLLLAGLALAASTFATFTAATLSAPAAMAAYPDRPVTLIVPWGAGGGTDAVARIVASLLEKDLGQPVAVVNRTGGQGVVGHQAIADATPDGYTIGIVTVEIAMMHWQGLTQLSGASYTPLALMNDDPAGVQVRADAPYKTLDDLLADIKANPGRFKASGTGQGGIWHLALAGMLSSVKMDPKSVPWVPSNGAAAGLQDLMAGGVQVVTCSLPEARSLIDAGRVKSLAIMSTERSKLMPAIPTLKEAAGSPWTIGAWRGIVGPKGLDKAISDKLQAALRKAYDSKEYQDFLSGRGFGGRYADGPGFAAFMAQSDASLGAVMKEVGLAK